MSLLFRNLCFSITKLIAMVEGEGSINLIKYNNAVTAKMKNRRVNVISVEDDKFLLQFVIKDGFKEERVRSVHSKGADFTTIKLSEEAIHALYYALQKMLEMKYKERN